MRRIDFLKTLLGSALTVPFANELAAKPALSRHLWLWRHATVVITLADRKILIDPMFSPKDAMDPVQPAESTARIPMTDLPFTKDEMLSHLTEIDAVFVTHTHRDHWDAEAVSVLDKNIPVFCQPADYEKISAAGFQDVRKVDKEMTWGGMRIIRTKGHHGRGETGTKMGEVSGFVFVDNGYTLYIAGDTVYCQEVEEAIKKYEPGMIVLNAGGARFKAGDPITMTPADIRSVLEHTGDALVVAVHMDTLNHCVVRRTDLLAALKSTGDAGKVQIPADGEQLAF